MAKVKLYNQEGASIGELELAPALFDVAPKSGLVHEAMVAQAANARTVLAHTKDRSEVRGGGRKPWHQKGTGRARHGSTRSPIWVGGGITFGPTSERNFAKRINKKVRRKALAMTLTDKVANGKFVAIDTLVLTEPKTKFVAGMLKKLPLAGKKTLVVVEPGNRDFLRASQNLPRVSTISAKSLNIIDILSHEYLLASKQAVDVLTQTYAK